MSVSCETITRLPDHNQIQGLRELPPAGWGDTLPEWLKTDITLERLEVNMKALKV